MKKGSFMERINRILTDSDYRKYIEKNCAAEEERIFCRHNMEHFLDVARIAWILNLEEQLGITKEWIYAAALLHDIGRHVQYENGIPHEEASAQLASAILKRCGFASEEEAVILEAIRGHRDAASLEAIRGHGDAQNVSSEKDLAAVICRADKLSRACYTCPVSEECNWSREKKNLKLKY